MQDDDYKTGQLVQRRWPAVEQQGVTGALIQVLWSGAPVCYVEWPNGEVEKTYCRYLTIVGNYDGKGLRISPPDTGKEQ